MAASPRPGRRPRAPRATTLDQERWRTSALRRRSRPSHPSRRVASPSLRSSGLRASPPPPVEASVDSPSESPSAEPPAAEPPAAEPPATAFAEEETSGPSIRDSIPDELEHTNPWLVPQLSSDIEKAAAELREGRDKHKIDSEETK
jgi:hypothetical protein